MEVGSSEGGATAMMCDLRTYYTLYCVCVITSGRTRGAAAEEDVVREPQLKLTQSGSSNLKRTQSGSSNLKRIQFGEQQLKRIQFGEQQLKRIQFGEQQLKRMQLGCSSIWWLRETSARQRHYHTRLLVHQSRAHRHGEGGETTEAKREMLCVVLC